MKQFTFLLFAFVSISSIAQSKYLTKTGTVSFEASLPSFEEVAAHNKSVTAILNTENGDFAALALVKAFRFKNALMEEHFNENYADSDDYPKTTFRGKISNFNFKNISADETALFMDGYLKFHNVTKTLKQIPLSLKTVEGKLVLKGSFTVLASDFDIDIPKVVKNKLSNEISITLNFELVKI